MTTRLSPGGLLIGAWLSFAAFAAELPVAVQAEISYLLSQLERSGCEFLRNGSWHSASAARAHLEKKLGYLRDKGMIATTEDFIERAATRSSVSGEPYEVRCAASAPVSSAQWLGDVLRRHRSK